MKNTTILLCLIAILISCNHKNKHQQKAKQSIEVLQKWYNHNTGLYENTSWWNAANSITVLCDYMQISGDQTYLSIVDNTFEKCKQFEVQMPDTSENWICTNFINDYYDDEGWWVLAWLKAYDLTKHEKYLRMGKAIFADLTLGWDSVCGGGIYWKKPNIAKSAVQNELFMLAALRLHLRSQEKTVSGKTYLEWAEACWHWFEDSGMINKNYLIENGLDKNCQPSQGRYYTYNQGMILSAMVEFSKIKNDRKYLELAEKIALATIQNLVYENRILKDPTEPNPNGDAVQFKGIFMRHLGYLYGHSPKPVFKAFIQQQAESIWQNAVNTETGEFGAIWTGPFDKADAARQTSAVDALNAAMICLD